jgi:hypothetical protein
VELAVELDAGADEVADLLAPADEADATDDWPARGPEENDHLFACERRLTQHQAHASGGNIDGGNSQIAAGAARPGATDNLHASPRCKARRSRPWGLRRLGGEASVEHNAWEDTDGSLNPRTPPASGQTTPIALRLDMAVVLAYGRFAILPALEVPLVQMIRNSSNRADVAVTAVVTHPPVIFGQGFS